MIPSEEGAQPKRESLEERLARTPWQDFGSALGIAAAQRTVSHCWSPILSITKGRSRFSICFVVLAGMRLRRWPTVRSGRPQRAALEFSVYSAALHVLHQQA